MEKKLRDVPHLAQVLVGCPFCGATPDKLEYSFKNKGVIGGTVVHACIYCKNCNAYGPRVTKTYKYPDEFNRYRERNDEDLMHDAIRLWDWRSDYI